MDKLKHFSLFSGIESFKKALTNLGIDNELVGYSEFDKYASVALSAIHGVSEELNYGDITKIDEKEVPDCDLITYGFPCQDISIAGHQKGIVEGETRSGLLYDALRIIKYKKPKYAIAENVKNLVGKKFIDDFNSLLEELDSYGYNNYWQVLNSKDYGIPQNRERVFIVSIRKDVDTGDFSFPKGFDNGLRLKDFLEDEVDEKFYISNEKTEKLIKQLDFKNKELLGIDLTINQPKFKDHANCIKARYDAGVSNQRTDGTGVCEPMLFGGEQKNQAIKTDGISTCLTSSMGTGGGYVPMVTEACIPCITPDREEKRQNGRRFKEDGDPMFTLTGQDRHGVLQVGNIVDTGNWENPQRGRIYSAEGCSPSLNTVGGGGLEPKILRPERTEYGKAIRKQYEAGEIEESRHNMTELKPREDGISNTLTTVQKDNLLLEPKIVCEQRTDEGLRFFKDGCVGTLRTIDSCGDKRVLEPRAVKLQNSNMKGRRIKDPGEPMFTVTAHDRSAVTLGEQTNNFRIRKLTPKECWRLMGFTDEDYWKARQALEDRFYNGKDRSNSQMYKMAGNSIVVEVLEGIFKQMF